MAATATMVGTVEQAERRAIHAIELTSGFDLRALAEGAVTERADVLGMAGGDGSQAIVASVAAQHGLAHVCIPSGTRNHLAIKLGLDRDDVVGALDADGEAIERTIDLADGHARRVDPGKVGVAAVYVASRKAPALTALEATGRLTRFKGFRQRKPLVHEVEADRPVRSGSTASPLIEPPLRSRTLPAACSSRCTPRPHYLYRPGPAS